MAASLLRFDDPAAFLASVGGFLAEREAEHNLLFGILDALRRDPGSGGGRPYLAAAVDGGRVVAVALRTPPWSLVLSEVDDRAAIDLIVADLATSDEPIPGVVGPAGAARDLAESWTARTGRPHHQGLRQRVFRVSRVVAPRPVPGRMRLAGDDDLDLLTAWLTAFDREALPPEENLSDPRETVERWLRTGTKRNYLWELDGRPVSWAGVGGRTPHGTRVGPVYTPPEDRGRGYASSLVAAASQAQLDDGLAYCFLFTDLANPTANHIYQAIGYEAVSDVESYFFG